MSTIIRWCYKTVHYELKKEGILGGIFFDEAEIEESLNEFGRAGWELVSIMEIQGGLIAIFKQPITIPPSAVEVPVKEIIRAKEPVQNELVEEDVAESDNDSDRYDEGDNDGVGTIRIE